MSALDVQVGGYHYKQMKIQPIEFMMKFGRPMDVCQEYMLKYMSRYPDKNGIEDLRKVYHCSQLRSELKVRQGDFKFEDYFMQFDGLDARIMALICEGNTAEAAEIVRDMIKDAL